MAAVTSHDLLEELRVHRLLEHQQLEEVERTLVGLFPEPKQLAKELMQRGWLSPYQVNQVLLGRGGNLVLGSYILMERLGEGGMGEVFKARNWKTGKIVAVKLIRKERLADAAATRRFKREIEAAAQLSHPNVVHAYDADEVGGALLLVMEYVEGTDLSRLVKIHGPLPVEDACDFICQAASGLQHAFERGMVHRDIKPHNLLITGTRELVSGVKDPAAPPSYRRPQSPVVKILDMGLGRITQANDDGNSSSVMTQEGAVMGTPDYIAPEQAREAHTVDIRADLYSLGCTFYFLLTGGVPFPKGSLIQKLTKHQFDEPAAVESLRPEVPAHVGAIVRKLMAKRAEDRFQTPNELIDALTGQVNPAGATAFSVTEAVASAAQAAPSIQVPRDPQAKNDDTAALWSSVVTPPITSAALPAAGPRKNVSSRGIWIMAAAAGVVLVVLLIVMGINLGRGKARLPDGKQADGNPPAAKVFTKVDESWLLHVAGLPADEQVQEVVRMLRELNPTFDGALRPAYEGDTVSGVDFRTDQVADITPLRALRKLKRLECAGRPPRKGKLGDLAPLKGLALEYLDCRHTQVVDLTPLKGMPLRTLLCSGTSIVDLAPLKGLPLKELDLHETDITSLSALQGLPLIQLNCGETRVMDLAPLQGMPLKKLDINFTGVWNLAPLKGLSLTDLACNNTDVADLTPVRSMPLRHLSFDYKPWRDTPVVRSLTTLETINGAPEKKFWIKADLDRAKFEAWAAKVAKLPAKKQLADVIVELKKRNRSFKGTVTPTIKNDVIIGLRLGTNDVTDLSPVRALPGLETLDCRGDAAGQGRLTDLSPLEGLRLTALICYYNKVADLAPLKGQPLTELNCDYNPIEDLAPLRDMPLTAVSLVSTKIKDLAPLAGMRLTSLRCGLTGVEDLSPLKGMPLTSFTCDSTPVKSLASLERMPLTSLSCARTKVADLTPLKDMPLTALDITAINVVDLAPLRDLPLKSLVFAVNPWRDREVLRSIETLQTINARPAAEMWKERDVLDAWCKKVAALKPEAQEKAVAEELKKRNPGFSGLVSSEVGIVASFQFQADKVLDVSPVRALPKLKRLTCAGSGIAKGQLADLWPLHGLPLVYLNADNTRVADLAPLRGMPLEYLYIGGTAVTDLSPLRGVPLKEIRCNFQAQRDMEILRSLPALLQINGQPASEFLDKAAPKK